MAIPKLKKEYIMDKKQKGRVAKLVSFRASAHTGVGISWILEHLSIVNDGFYFYLGDCHTSLRTGSQ